MGRPSRNIDTLLLAAGRELLPEVGAAGLSVRSVAARAGVNPGMFHYHFRTKDAFVARLLQETYDSMFEHLELAAAGGPAPMALHAALCVLGRFARDHAKLLRRLFVDALGGDPHAGAFLRANVPRHLGVLARLVERGQREGVLRRMPVAQAVALLGGGVAAPLIVASALSDTHLAGRASARAFANAIGTDAAIAERAACAIAGLAASTTRRRLR
ncbi:MAG: TetR/AcrR family transcriptional regulator [Proteobacteria bacterium]|jgi:AcrR family transcriptional regulator|nr:TetR/AcrR family transcriptional regulator [Pseudomonadota bacterium]